MINSSYNTQGCNKIQSNWPFRFIFKMTRLMKVPSPFFCGSFYVPLTLIKFKWPCHELFVWHLCTLFHVIMKRTCTNTECERKKRGSCNCTSDSAPPTSFWAEISLVLHNVRPPSPTLSPYFTVTTCVRIRINFIVQDRGIGTFPL